jgi:hypothetical protein
MANEEKVRNMMKTQDEVIMKLIDLMPSQAIPNVAYKNKGGFNFENKTADFGLASPSFSNGSAYGDLDNDGDLDLVVNNVNMPSFIYENKTDTLTHKSLFIRFSSTTKNTQAIGTKATIFYGNEQTAMAENYTSRGFQSSVSDGIHFGLDKVDLVDSLIITWPNGTISKEQNLSANHTYTFSEPEKSSTVSLKNNRQTPNLVFPELAPLFHFKHIENTFVDFNRERLLPYMSNNEGPALAVGDVNADGIMDVYVGGAKNQSGSIFISVDNKYNEIKIPFEADSRSEDTDAIFFDSDNDGDLDLYVCSGGKAFSKYDALLYDRLYINNQGVFSKAEQPLPFSTPISSATVATTDFDNDGDLDLFVGGRFDPELYGTAVSSYILVNKGENRFEIADQKELIDLGMVTDATWSDINGDGWEDLIVLGEWMPIKIFINKQGILFDETASFDLNNSNGMWSSLIVSDLDNDGDMDILGGNIGKNTYYKSGLRMYIKDFDGNGFAEQIICHNINGKYYPIVDRDELISQLPGLKNKFLYFKDYATATIEDLFTKDELLDAMVLEVDMVETTLFINKNGKFTKHHLPSEVQYSNISAIEILDADNDGVKDFVLGGNQYLIKPQFGRQDASKGWLVLGQLDQAQKYSTKNVKSLGIKGQIRNFALLPYKHKTILLTAINNEEIIFREIQ